MTMAPSGGACGSSRCYLSDGIVLFRYFEAAGTVLKAVTIAKSRVSPHETGIREFRLGPAGVQVGEPLEDFEGVLCGLPAYRGKTALMEDPPAAAP